LDISSSAAETDIGIGLDEAMLPDAAVGRVKQIQD
jgi:hypothetical protein